MFLGLASGLQPIELQTDATVKSIRLTLAGREIARFAQPPWRGEIDLGSELVPRQLEAIAYDENGNEVGRASQFLNLPRANAEVEIVLHYSGMFPSAAQLRWRNLEHAEPSNVAMTFDGLPLRVNSDFRARFPQTDWLRPHVIDAQIRFRDGMVARREIVVGGALFSDTARAELTPVLLTETSSKQPQSYENCFSIDGTPVRTSAVEKEDALVILVRDPDPSEAVRALDPGRRAVNAYTRAQMRLWATFDTDTREQILWPIARSFVNRSSHETSILYEHTHEFEPREGLMYLLTYDAAVGSNKPRQYTDAVAVAGIRAIANGRRRAVILLLSDQPDFSRNDPRAVRRYLASIGVPLFVWSASGPRPDLAERWGSVDDISSVDLLRAAAAKVRKTLATQRIAWVHADPLSALRIQADERCGVATVAR
jgi:hypothetical protein